jgi:hypothetical protein
VKYLPVRSTRFHDGLQASCIVPLSIEFDKIKTLEYDIYMSSLLEIEEAADVLPTEEKRELVAFLLTRLRGDGDELSPVRDIPKSTIDKWVADDEEGYRKFLAGA